ncbi:hypothetical protein REPUB_Repub20aG0092600 [Reevesia pubescens]
MAIRVKRYWPRKAPEWADDDDADEGDDIRMALAIALEKAYTGDEDSGIVKHDDPRLCHLCESRIVNRDEIRVDHKRIRQAEIVSTEEEGNRKNEGV